MRPVISSKDLPLTLSKDYVQKKPKEQVKVGGLRSLSE